MQIVIDIPEEQIKKSLKESEYVLEGEGIKGFVNIVMLYTNGRLEFVDIERREEFYSCNFMPLPKGHGRLIDVNDLLDDINLEDNNYNRDVNTGEIITLENIDRIPTIIKADKAESEDKE